MSDAQEGGTDPLEGQNIDDKIEDAFESARSAFDAWGENTTTDIVSQPEHKQVAFNRVELEFDEVDDAEEKAREYYSELGFNVFPVLKRFQNYIDEFPWFKNHNVEASEKGIPDLFAFRMFQEVTIDPYEGIKTENIMDHWKFVEVKSENDALRMSQLEWFANHPDMPIDVAVIKEVEK